MSTDNAPALRPTGFGPLELDDRPITRRDLQFAPFEIEGASQIWVRDLALGQTHILSMHEIDVLSAMNGERSFREIFDDIRSRFVVDDGPLAQFCERLEWKFLILTLRNRDAFEKMQRWNKLKNKPKRHQYRRVPARDVLDGPFVIDPELRHDCLHSGHCCRQYAIVLTDDKLATLKKHRFETLPAERPSEFSDPSPPKEGEPQTHVLKRTEGDWCHFHVNDRCAVHAELGAAAKPIPCRLFPIDVIYTPQGIRPFLLHECATQHRTFASGTPIAERQEELRATLRAEPQMVLRATPESVYLLESLKVSYEAYRMLAWRMGRELEPSARPDRWWEKNAAIWSGLKSWYESSDEVAWPTLIDGIAETPHEPDAARRCSAAASIAVSLCEVVTMLALLHKWKLVRNLNSEYVRLDRFQSLLEGLVERLRDGQWPTLDAERDETAAYLRRFLHNHLDSHQALYYPTASDGFAVLRLLWICVATSVEASADEGLDELALVHRELAWWLTLFRFDEVRAALSDLPSAETEALLEC
ncbi:MAG: hypothetical protein KC609_15440 [Myxococcales bacterium]|nr:hypothetical protein [Myxococcales bacterium]